MAAALRFWFQVISMTWDRGFDQREENGEWRPPRPLGSNVPVGDNSDSVWYEYRNGQTTQVQEPDSDLTTHFKTFSFYFDNGFWIYPCNAIRYQVGDGEIHPPPNDSDTDGEGDSGITDDGNTDEPEDDNRLEDWKPLEFDWDIDTGTSFATIRAEHAVLQTQRPDQAWLRQILPAWYFAPQAEHTTAAERGGLVGKIPILIALIAFSVQPHLVTDALMHCLGRSYNLHHQPPGLGWIPRRGLVVRVLREKDIDEQDGQQGQQRQVDSAFERMRSFEHARSGYRNFFP